MFNLLEDEQPRSPVTLPQVRLRRVDGDEKEKAAKFAYQTTGWLLVLVIATFCDVMVLKWYLK